MAVSYRDARDLVVAQFTELDASAFPICYGKLEGSSRTNGPPSMTEASKCWFCISKGISSSRQVNLLYGTREGQENKGK